MRNLIKAQEKEEAPTIALCLSGGGFRASLFHLGVLKRLDELGILERVTHISSVSGGSVTAALYVYLKSRTPGKFAFATLEKALVKFVKEDPAAKWFIGNLIRKIAFRIFSYPAGIFGSFLGFLSPTVAFSKFFRSLLFHETFVSQLAPTPNTKPPHLIINATGLERGEGFYFTPTYIGPDKDNALAPKGAASVAGDEVALSLAVGASACVPAIFPPAALNLKKTAAGVGRAHLVDGGVYDNQAMSVFLADPFKPKGTGPSIDYLIASDASRTLAPEKSGVPPWYIPFKVFALLFRAHDITEDHARFDRFELLWYKQRDGAPKQAAFFHTVPLVPPRSPYGVPKEMGDLLAGLRTDFDRFSDLEIAGLMYHGYTLTDSRVLNHCAGVFTERLSGGKSIKESVEDLRKARDKRGDKASVQWEDLEGLPTSLKLPKRWGAFWNDIQTSWPPGFKENFVRNLLDKPWRSLLEANDLDALKGSDDWKAGMSHLKRGSLNWSVWRDLCRLGDWGGAYWCASFAFRWSILFSAFSLAYFLVPITLVKFSCLARVSLWIYGAAIAVLLWMAQ